MGCEQSTPVQAPHGQQPRLGAPLTPDQKQHFGSYPMNAQQPQFGASASSQQSVFGIWRSSNPLAGIVMTLDLRPNGTYDWNCNNMIHSVGAFAFHGGGYYTKDFNTGMVAGWPVTSYTGNAFVIFDQQYGFVQYNRESVHHTPGGTSFGQGGGLSSMYMPQIQPNQGGSNSNVELATQVLETLNESGATEAIGNFLGDVLNNAFGGSN